MPVVTANGIQIYYERSGTEGDPAVMMIPGLGGQLPYWTPGIVDPIVDAGFDIIRIDNRDAGYSQHFDGVKVNVMRVVEILTAGGTPEVPYLLADMADDVAGVLDALGIDAAHIVGSSMGGMVAQTFAIRHPDRTLTLTSIMSTTGNPDVGQATPEMNEALFTAPPADREAAIESTVEYSRLAWADHFDEARSRETAARNLDRVVYQQGVGRQFAAILASGDRTADLATVTAATLVIHGEKDPLIDISGGRATAAAVPGAVFWEMPGVGHDMPPALYGELTKRLVEHFRSV
ncbi:MAG TPA: alpha/beta hydrolase [Acidimicrobiia bacterium]|nr:alpha/beta hydrolase [Acidimicrobiia bacterium]